MAIICEKLIEEMASGPDSLSQEMQKHVLTCPSCQATLATVKELKHARKCITGKEAASIAAILSAVKKGAAAGATVSNATAATATKTTPVIATALIAAAVATAALFLTPHAEKTDNTEPVKAMNSIQTEQAQEVYITTAEDTALGTDTAEIEVGAGSKLTSEDEILQLSDNSSIKIKFPSVYNHANEKFTLLKGSAMIDAMQRSAPLEISTPLADVIIQNGSAEIISTEKNLSIKVLNGEVKVLPGNSDKELIIKAGQEWNISPEKDTIDPVGTILVSPDQEELNSN